MSNLFKDAYVRSHFVGRERDLRSLREAWQRANDGQRQVVFLSGEPGIGKTRLAGELADMVQEDGAIVLSGRSNEEGLIAYEPFIEALRQHFLASPDNFPLEDLGPFAADLARPLPELSRYLSGLNKSQTGDPEAERYRLFEAVALFLVAVARRQPCLLLLDDLHWADRGTLLLLRHIVRSPPPGKAHDLSHIPRYRSGPHPPTGRATCRPEA